MTNVIARTVRPVHFEDFGGQDFERLVFAYHLRAGWSDLAWYAMSIAARCCQRCVPRSS